MKSTIVCNRFVILVVILSVLLICSCQSESGEKVESKGAVANQAGNGGAAPVSSVSPVAATSDQTAKIGPDERPDADKKGNPSDPQPQIGTGGNDLFLFTKARAVLSNDDELKGANIIVAVKGGAVTLSGVVRNTAQRLKAEELVRAIEGVKEVKNRLRIST